MVTSRSWCSGPAREEESSSRRTPPSRDQYPLGTERDRARASQAVDEEQVPCPPGLFVFMCCEHVLGVESGDKLELP